MGGGHWPWLVRSIELEIYSLGLALRGARAARAAGGTGFDSAVAPLLHCEKTGELPTPHDWRCRKCNTP
jgi:hypothetical protein